MILFLDLGGRAWVLAVRVLDTLLAAVEHVVLVLVSICVGATVLVVELLGRLLKIFSTLGSSFLARSTIVLLVLDLNLGQ